MAKRIRARAIKQMGVLLREFDGRGGDRKSYRFAKKDAADHFILAKKKQPNKQD